eukprot:1159491-Pelagomonas_calceolata.AAC.30
MGNLCGKPEVPAGTYVVQQQRLNDLEAIERGLAPAKAAVATPGEQQQLSTTQQQQPPTTQQQQQDAAPLKAAALSSTTGGGGSNQNSAASNIVTSSNTGKPSFSAPTDLISETLQAAHLELKNNSIRNFEDYYVLDKIIGHGAFAKVSICTCRNGSQQQYAVKAVQKNPEDTTGKQREGRCREGDENEPVCSGLRDSRERTEGQLHDTPFTVIAGYGVHGPPPLNAWGLNIIRAERCA